MLIKSALRKRLLQAIDERKYQTEYRLHICATTFKIELVRLHDSVDAWPMKGLVYIATQQAITGSGRQVRVEWRWWWRVRWCR